MLWIPLLFSNWLFAAEPALVTPRISYDWNQVSETETLVNVLDTDVLNSMENSGYGFSEMLGGGKYSKTSEIYKNNLMYRSFADSIGEPLPHDLKTDQLPAQIPSGKGDIPELVRRIRGFEDKGKRSAKDLTSGYFIRRLSNNSQYPYSVEFDGDEPRHFDERWLNSNFAFFKLIAVVNRLDRVDFNPLSCGEVRFVYRLSYQSPKSSSSLPFFVNLVYQYPSTAGCSAFAKKWLITKEKSLEFRKSGASGFISFLRSGPLKDLTFEKLEMNFQSLRFTSGYMQDFGGQAMYLLRTFKPFGDQLQAIALENTPDVLTIEKNPDLLKKFVAYLKEGDHLARLDQGILNIDFDPKFLAKLAVSWSTSGRARSANKPYTRLFQNEQELLKSIDLSGLKYIQTHDALVERLNNLTCMGCHQSGGTAGFHMLGFPDSQFSHGFNRQELPMSPHAYAEIFRRKNYVQSLAEGGKPNLFRPHSNFPEANWAGSSPVFKSAGLGQMCALKKSFAGAPNCADSLQCQETVTNSKLPFVFGECVDVKTPTAGSACWKGEVSENRSLPTGESPSFNFFAFQDKWKLNGSLPLPKKANCGLPQGGAPLGRSSWACSLEDENFSALALKSIAEIPRAICANQGGNGFDLCAASGDSGSCLESRVVRSMLDTCYPGRFCREDYICQKMPDYDKISLAHYTTKKNGKKVNLSTPEKIKGEFIRAAQANHIGFCAPTYFLFNMRLDGHPSPVTGLPPGEPRVDRNQPVRGYKK